MEIDNNPNMEVTPKTYPCKINSSWMRSLERANISITTPKGGTARVSKCGFAKCTEEQQELVWKVYANTEYSEVRWEWGGNAHGSDTIELTREEIQLFHDAALASNGSVRQAWKPKPKSFMQRKFESKQESRRTGIRAGICGCGGSLRTKDHGTWVGYYCPQCKCGSSYNK
jgi:hypothetical protein